MAFGRLTVLYRQRLILLGGSLALQVNECAMQQSLELESSTFQALGVRLGPLPT